MNIVSIIMQFIGPAIVGKLASSLGINSTIAQKAIGAAVPAILGGLIGRASQPSGGQAIFDMLGKQDPGLLGNLGNLIGGSQQKSIAEQGMGALGSLLGGTALGSLSGAVSKFAGIGDEPTKGLLGMLAPVVLGSVGQQAKSSGLDAGGLAKMLIGQKDNISAAMPGEFAKMLGGTGLLDGLGGSLSGAASAAAGAAGRVASGIGQATGSAGKMASQAAGHAASRVETAARSASGGSSSWLPWVLAALAALLGYWYFFTAPKQAALPTPPRIMVGDSDVGGQLGGFVGNLRMALGEIRDVPTAQVALLGLRKAQGDADRLAGLAAGLPADGKKQVASYMTAALPVLKPVIDRHLASSSVGPILKPVLEPILAKLTGLQKL
jgi:hypothetical protein